MSNTMNKETEIIEGNKLIAEFMGFIWEEKYNGFYKPNPEWDIYNGKKSWTEKIDAGKAKYHTSWDWLMPVCKKIIEMYFDKREDIFSGLTNVDIEITWRAVVDFIDFWNDDTKEKIIWSNCPVHKQQLKWRHSPKNSWYNTTKKPPMNKINR